MAKLLLVRVFAGVVVLAALPGCYASGTLGSTGIASLDWAARNFTLVAEQAERTDCYSTPIDYGAAIRALIDENPPADALLNVRIEYKMQWFPVPPLGFGVLRECSHIVGDAVVLK